MRKAFGAFQGLHSNNVHLPLPIMISGISRRSASPAAGIRVRVNSGTSLDAGIKVRGKVGASPGAGIVVHSIRTAIFDVEMLCPFNGLRHDSV